MKLSAKAQYAARAIFYLSKTYGNGPTALHKISDNQEISGKYLENIMNTLMTVGIVRSDKGKNGGFSLARPPAEITMNDIMVATEGKFLPVACIKNPESCNAFEECGVRDAWLSLGKVVTEHLKSINFQDMIDRQRECASQKESRDYY